jgi:hypothetical protein
LTGRDVALDMSVVENAEIYAMCASFENLEVKKKENSV